MEYENRVSYARLDQNTNTNYDSIFALASDELVSSVESVAYLKNHELF